MDIWAIYAKYKSIILYVFFGGITTFINIATYWLLAQVFDCGTVVSNTIAWIFAVLFAFVTNKRYVFEMKSSNVLDVLKAFISFITFRLISGGIDLIIMVVGVDMLHFNNLLTKIVDNVIVLILNYLASKLFIFKKTS